MSRVAHDALLPDGERAHGGFVLVLTPGEAGAFFGGWDGSLWLVLARGPDGDSWRAVSRSDVRAALGAHPCWPPLDGVPVHAPAAEDELDLLRAFACQDAACVLASASPVRPTGVLDIVDW